MTDDALKNLLDSGIRNTQYTMDSAKRVRAYLATGGDPQSLPPSGTINTSAEAMRLTSRLYLLVAHL